MKVALSVILDGRYWSGGASVEVPELLHEAFEPLETTDDIMLAAALGEKVMAEEIMKVVKLREDAAEILAKKLKDMIINEMSKHDTHNGYKK